MTQFITSVSPMPRGYAGQLTRGFFDSTIETKEAAEAVDAGLPVKLDSTGKAAALTAGSDAVYGFVLREYGQVDAAGEQSEAFVPVLRRGYLAVKAAGTPAPGGQVYLTAAGALTAEKASNTALAGASFCGKADAGGLVEIAYNI